jgi:hypothetical protein
VRLCFWDGSLLQVVEALVVQAIHDHQDAVQLSLPARGWYAGLPL